MKAQRKSVSVRRAAGEWSRRRSVGPGSIDGRRRPGRGVASGRRRGGRLSTTGSIPPRRRQSGRKCQPVPQMRPAAGRSRQLVLFTAATETTLVERSSHDFWLSEPYAN
ncbi:hypothetical protein MRX96_006600 [Rhipicephalus microplus]